MQSKRRFRLWGILFASFFAGCGGRDYYVRDYQLNQEKIVTVGSVIMGWQYGTPGVGGSAVDLRKELTYAGIDHDVLQVTYREFSSNYARPAFYQQLKYDISKDKHITFQDVVIDVLNADQSQITFIVRQEPEVMRAASSVISSSSNPCLDSLYLVLDKKGWNSMTRVEREYYFKKGEECEAYRKVMR
jgi:hypothetical protein